MLGDHVLITSQAGGGNFAVRLHHGDGRDALREQFEF